MSVAETRVTEKAPPRSPASLALGSVLGALYVLASLALVFAILPTVWHDRIDQAYGPDAPGYMNDFLSTALLVIVALAVAVLLGFIGHRLLQGHDRPGLRAGIFCAAAMIFASLWIAVALGNTFQARDILTEGGGSGGLILVGVIALALLAGVVFLFTTPGWARFLYTFDAQGWFSGSGYKPNQGVRVRRGTVIGILALGIAGIITMYTHRLFGSDRVTGHNDWFWTIPYTSETVGSETFSHYVPLMFKVHALMPILLGLLVLWLAWRIVNIPTFADFLIATEAEMNKVSWSSRRRLFQDTIVVLVTVFLFTAFLFFTDLLWIKVLSNEYIRVLIVDVRAEQQKNQEKTQW